MPFRVSSVAGFALVVLLSGCAAKHSAPSNPGGGGGAAKEMDSPDIPPGGSYTHRFFTAGDFAYHCRFHAPMTGTATVNASAADTTFDVSITSATSPFPASSVKPGGTITWHNNDTHTHSVTSN
jgi:plastocyanin